ncbi:hypothetical protein CF327_g4723 [Tilletia walkeri]|nr:hypothetical protein CF327_g4723 [Tilletia walkeri]
MIAEVLAALAGHGSLSSSALPNEHQNDHAGERAVLTHLRQLAAQYVRIKRFATTQLEYARINALRSSQQQQQSQSSRAAGKRREQQQHVSGATGCTTHLVPLCQTILAVLREYERLVLETEHKLIYGDPALVAARCVRPGERQDFVSLATLRSIFEVWERPLSCLGELVDQLIRGPPESSADGSRAGAVDASHPERTVDGVLPSSAVGTPAGASSTAEIIPEGPRKTTTAGSSKLLSSTRWTGGQLIDVLVIRSTTSVGAVQRIMKALLSAVESSFMRRLQVWLCRGDARPSGGAGQRSVEQDTDRLVEMAIDQTSDEEEDDAEDGTAKPSHSNPALAGVAQHLSPGIKATQTKQHGLTFLERRWRFRQDALPSSVTEETAQNILTVGRVLSAVRASSRTAAFTSLGARAGMPRVARGETDAAILSPELYQAHTALLQQADIRPSHEIEFAEAMQRIRENVCEWLWQNVLTIGTVVTALQALGDYALQRNGSFALSFQSEIDETRRKKLLSAKSATGAALQVADLDMAFHRASLGSTAEDDPALERFHFVMPKVRVRRAMPRILLNATGDISRSRVGEEGGERSMFSQSRLFLDKFDESARFDDLLLGVPAQLHYTAAFPLDLFLSPMDLAAYSRLFSFLGAMRRTQGRVLDCWSMLSKSQRVRRRFTGTGEGGVDKKEENERKVLLRKGWGLTRKMAWFLDTLMGHFQTDIIEVQYTRLIAQLQSTVADDEEDGDDDDVRTTSATGVRSRHSSTGRVTTTQSRRRVSSTPSRPNRASSLLSSNEPVPPLPQVDIGSFDGVPRDQMPIPPEIATPPLISSPTVELPSSGSPTKLSSRPTSRRRAPPSATAATVVRRSSGVSAGSVTGRGGLPPPPRNSTSAFPSRASTVIMPGGGAKLRGLGSGGLGSYVFPSSPTIASRGGVLSAVGAGTGVSVPGGAGGAKGTLDALKQNHLDFNSLQATHSAFLAFVLDGLLLSSPAASRLLRAILELCDQFVGTVERWGGDVVPDLLSEGSLNDSGGMKPGGTRAELNKTAFRQRITEQVNTELDELLAEVFRLLSSPEQPVDALDASANRTRGGQSGVGSLSLLSSQVPLARADQSLSRVGGANSSTLHAQKSRGRAGHTSEAQIRNEARLQADLAARRHLEQLLLRLDFNHHFSDKVRMGGEEDLSLGLPRSGSGQAQTTG